MTPAATILHITDLHMMPRPGETLLGIDTESSFQAVLVKALTENSKIDLILLTGDLAQDPSPQSYQKIRAKLEGCGIPCVSLPGNHDDYSLMLKNLNSGLFSCRKQLILKNWQIICLNSQIPDSPGGHLPPSELRFLEDCLQHYPDYPTLIAVHHHCLEISSQWMDTMMIDNGPEFLATATNYPNVKAILCGHIHQEMEQRIGPIQLLGTPSTCFQFSPGSKCFSIDDASPGYRIIELHADGHIESKISRLPEKLTGLETQSSSY